METLSSPMLSHLTTFGGNPVCCAASKAAIEYMKRENLPAKAVERGQQFIAGLQAMQTAYPEVIKEVRGKGLLLGFELPSRDVMARFVQEVHKENVIIGDSLNDDLTARLEPPLTITAAQVDDGLARLARACEATARSLAVD
jgi:putrescine aminotransferase